MAGKAYTQRSECGNSGQARGEDCAQLHVGLKRRELMHEFGKTCSSHEEHFYRQKIPACLPQFIFIW